MRQAILYDYNDKSKEKQIEETVPTWNQKWLFLSHTSNEYSELISFRFDWFDLFTVQGTLKSLLQYHNSFYNSTQFYFFGCWGGRCVCCREKANSDQVGNCLFDLLYAAFVIIINSMACLEDLAPLLDHKLNCLCLALGEKFCPAHLRIEEIKDTPSEGWRWFARLKPLPLYFPTASPSLFCCLTLAPHCFFFFCSVKEPGIQTPIRWLFWGTSLPSSWSASSLTKVSSLPQHVICWIHWPIVWWAERSWTLIFLGGSGEVKLADSHPSFL